MKQIIPKNIAKGLHRIPFIKAGLLFVIVFILAGLYPVITGGAPRFPRPDFESNYTVPPIHWLNSKWIIPEYINFIVLVITLTIAALLALKWRSRTGLFLLSVFSLIYFGFVRKGCVCMPGSLQNVILALFDSSYQLPLIILAFFLAPLIFTLFFGRVFCGSVCPVGVIQDLVILKPIKVPAQLQQIFSLFPYIYLGLTVLWVATGTGFLICRFDPFIGFFRLSGTTTTLMLGAAFLLLGTVIARPYCRFVCPYGVLLSWLGPFSSRHLQVTREECIDCRLCETACPSDLLKQPSEVNSMASMQRNGIKKLVQLLLILPVLIGLGGFAGSRLTLPLANNNAQIALYHQVQTEITAIKKGAIQAGGRTLETKAFWETGKPVDDLTLETGRIRRQFYFGGWLLGGFLGLVVGLKIIGLSLQRTRTRYEPDRANCLSCGRCLTLCPKNRVVKTNETV